MQGDQRVVKEGISHELGSLPQYGASAVCQIIFEQYIIEYYIEFANTNERIYNVQKTFRQKLNWGRCSSLSAALLCRILTGGIVENWLKKDNDLILFHIDIADLNDVK